MTTHRFFKVVRPAFGLLLIVTCAAATMAGGFELRAEAPQAGTAYSDAALIVRAFGCHQPSRAKVTGTAEGLVEGERRSVPLTMKSVDKGVWAVEAQWPAEGTWVLAFSGTYRNQFSSVLVEVGADGNVAMQKNGHKPQAQILHRKLSTRDVESALERTAHHQAAPSRKAKTR